MIGHAVTTTDHQVAEPASSGSKEAKNEHKAWLQMRLEITGLRAKAQDLLTVVLRREDQFQAVEQLENDTKVASSEHSIIGSPFVVQDYPPSQTPVILRSSAGPLLDLPLQKVGEEKVLGPSPEYPATPSNQSYAILP